MTEEGLNATVEGDGGLATFVIQTKNLEHVGVDVFSENIYFLHFYNDEGVEIDRSSPASEVSKIVYSTDLVNYEIRLKHNLISFVSLCNSTSSNLGISIRLEYSYGVRFIRVKVLPGKPLQLEDVQYFDELKIEERGEVRSQKFRFTNQGPLTQIYEVRPYLNDMPMLMVDPGHDSWLGISYNLTLPVPVYANGGWVLQEKSGIIPHTKYTYEGPDRLTKVEVDIPAYSSATIYTDVIYSKAQGRGMMTFRNEMLDLIIPVDFTVTSYYPTGHEIRVEIEDAK